MRTHARRADTLQETIHAAQVLGKLLACAVVVPNSTLGKWPKKWMVFCRQRRSRKGPSVARVVAFLTMLSPLTSGLSDGVSARVPTRHAGERAPRRIGTELGFFTASERSTESEEVVYSNFRKLPLVSFAPRAAVYFSASRF